jgi:hypothetical protein
VTDTRIPTKCVVRHWQHCHNCHCSIAAMNEHSEIVSHSKQVQDTNRTVLAKSDATVGIVMLGSSDVGRCWRGVGVASWGRPIYFFFFFDVGVDVSLSSLPLPGFAPCISEVLPGLVSSCSPRGRQASSRLSFGSSLHRERR